MLYPRHCERSEAIHVSTCGAMDCFASLAMTADLASLIATPTANLFPASIHSAACATPCRCLGLRNPANICKRYRDDLWLSGGFEDLGDCTQRPILSGRSGETKRGRQAVLAHCSGHGDGAEIERICEIGVSAHDRVAGHRFLQHLLDRVDRRHSWHNERCKAVKRNRERRAEAVSSRRRPRRRPWQSRPGPTSMAARTDG